MERWGRRISWERRQRTWGRYERRGERGGREGESLERIITTKQMLRRGGGRDHARWGSGGGYSRKQEQAKVTRAGIATRHHVPSVEQRPRRSSNTDNDNLSFSLFTKPTPHV